MKRWITRSLLFLLLGTVSLALLYAHRDSLLLSVTSLQVEKQAQNLLGGPLSYTSKQIEGGVLTLDNVTFRGGCAERITCKPKWLPGLKGVQVEAHILSPTLKPAPYPFTTAKRSQFWLAKVLRLKWECVVKEGHLLRQELIPFSAKASGEDTRKITLSLAVGEGELKLDYSSTLRDRRVHFDASLLPCDTLAPFFLPGGWESLGGIATACGTFHLPTKGLPWIEGDGMCEGFSVKKGPDHFTFHDLTFHLTPQRHLRRRALARLTTWDDVLLALCGEVMLQKGEISIGAVKVERASAKATFGTKEVYLNLNCLLNGTEPTILAQLDKKPTLARKVTIDWAQDARLEFTSEPQGKIGVHVVGLTPDKSGAISALIGPYFPLIAPYSHTEGTLSATLAAQSRKTLRHLWIRELSASNLSLTKGASSLHASELAGHLFLPHFRPGWEHECSARLFVEEGSFTSSHFGFEAVSGEVFMDSGCVERLGAKGSIGGLAFEASALPLPHAREVCVRLSGSVSDVTKHWPNEILKAHFEEDPFTLDLRFERGNANLIAEGTWEVGDDCLPFGFLCAPQRKAQNPLPHAWERVANTLLPPPRSRFPIELGPAKVLAFDTGWIEAKRVEAAKFIQPLLKGHPGLSIYGSVDLSAAFDGRALALDYEGYNMRLEHALFRITVPHTGDLSNGAPDARRAHHTFDLVSGAQKGSVPLKHATYIEKNKGLTFTHIRGCVALHEKGLNVPEMEGKCADIGFTGSVDMIRYAGVPTDLKLIANKAEGPLSGATQILNHLSPSPLWELKADGSTYLDEGGLTLRILFLPEKAEVEASVKGGMRGVVFQNDHGFALDNLAANFTYEHKGKHLTFEGILGDACFKEDISYPISAHLLAFDNFPKGNCQFALSLAGLAQLKGDITSISEEEKRLTLRSSYFGGIKPGLHTCTFKGGLERLRLTPEIQIETLGHDLKLLEQITGIRCASSLASSLRGKGLLSGEIALDASRHLWRVRLGGSKLLMRSHPFKSASVTAQGNKEGWQLALKADKLGCKAKLQGNEILEGIASWGQAITAHFSGQVYADRLEGSCLKCTFPLASVPSLPYLRDVPFLKEACGLVELTGPFRVEARGVSGDLSLALQDVHLSQIQLNEETKGRFAFEEGIFSVENVSLSPSPDGVEKADIKLGKLLFNPDDTTCQLTDLEFQLPKELLSWASAEMGVLFNKALPFDLTRASSMICREGLIAGRLSYSDEALTLDLAPGDYLICGTPLPIKSALLSSTPDKLALRCVLCVQSEDYYVTFFQQRVHSDKGELLVTSGDEEVSGDPLTLFWNFPKEGTPYLTRLEGNLKGISAHLTADGGASSQDTLAFFGSLKVDAPKAKALLPQGLSTFLAKAKVGAGYQLSGRFELPKEDPTLVTFTGDLSGRQFEACGYTFDRLSASLTILPNHFSIHSLAITDPTGRCSIDRIEGVKNGEGEWSFQTPLIRITNFQPTILTGKYKPYGKNKPLMITQGEIHHFSGSGDPATWNGVGSFSFQHPPRKDVAHTLFALPDDILGILGLDFQSLIPAAGKVNFIIGDGKCTLRSFADVHSRGRRSQFFLADDESSYIDFDGNISLRVRTKQYNLMLKITELFTVAIGGTLDKPTFRLQHPNKTTP